MMTYEQVCDWCMRHVSELRMKVNTENCGHDLTWSEYVGGGHSYISIQHWDITCDGSAQYIDGELVYTHGNFEPCLTVKVQERRNRK